MTCQSSQLVALGPVKDLWRTIKERHPASASGSYMQVHLCAHTPEHVDILTLTSTYIHIKVVRNYNLM